jgi:hypothetical protein
VPVCDVLANYHSSVVSRKKILIVFKNNKGISFKHPVGGKRICHLNIIVHYGQVTQTPFNGQRLSEIHTIYPVNAQKPVFSV